MDPTIPVVTSSLRVGIQVAGNHKRPVLEIYHKVSNTFGPEWEFRVPGGVSGTEVQTDKTRFQNIAVEFTLVNIGGARAEDICLSITGDLKRNRPFDDFGGAFEHRIPQFAPGQSQFLFAFRDYDLLEYPSEGGKASGAKKQTFTITATYRATRSPLQRLFALPKALLKRPQYKMQYTFNPLTITGELPPPEYLA